MQKKPTKEDRRTKLTRQRLHEALVSLAIERGYDAITVQEVLDRAEIARSTFYAHFRDKEDLLLSGFRDKGGPLFCNAAVAGKGSVFAGLASALFDHVYENRMLANAFSGSASSGAVFAHLRNLVIIEARNRLKARATSFAQEIPDEMIVQYVANTLFGLLTWWIDHNFPHTAKEISDACDKFLTNGLGPASALDAQL